MHFSDLDLRYLYNIQTLARNKYRISNAFRGLAFRYFLVCLGDKTTYDKIAWCSFGIQQIIKRRQPEEKGNEIKNIYGRLYSLYTRLRHSHKPFQLDIYTYRL